MVLFGTVIIVVLIALGAAVIIDSFLYFFGVFFPFMI